MAFSFFKKSPALPLRDETEGQQRKRFKRLQWSSFIAITLGYSMYYVCRTSLNVVKKPIMDSGTLDAKQLGVISSALLFTYAIGKFVNGFLADHSNIKRFMATGLLVSTVANIVVGILGLISTTQMVVSQTAFFVCFAVMWALNGWSQSMGAPPCVVALSRWYPLSRRGTFYGFWSLSHNLGEFFSFLLVGGLVGLFGWQYGFIGAAIAGVIGFLIIVFMLHDSPESKGLPSVAVLAGEETQQQAETHSIGLSQRAVMKNPYVWVLAFASAFMYVSRYAVNGWGVLFLQETKGFALTTATQVISINALLGIIGTVFSGWLSDVAFRGNRYIPAVAAGLLEVVSLVLFAFGGNSMWVNILSMVLFGIAIGVLICFLGGLMAVDIVPREAAGAALGVVGIASYAAAGLQDIASGLLIDSNKLLVDTIDGVEQYSYNFTPALWFWIAAALLSVLLVCVVWHKAVTSNSKAGK
ncbi:MAG: MFS transporter [Paludibacteraceae bacterium]|nr:MFS transporter [Paludibacteraceae bacterium]